MGSGPFQHCSITEQGIIGTDCNIESSVNHDKNFFALRVTEYWNELPVEVVKSSSLKILKTCLDTFLYNLLFGICFSRKVGLHDLQTSLSTPMIQ